MVRCSRLIIAVSSVLLFAAACQPKDERPGLWLSGTPATELIEDWRFTNAVEEIFVETRTVYGLQGGDIHHSSARWRAMRAGFTWSRFMTQVGWWWFTA